jgi:nucleoside-diphosphate-sugar epimerase
MRKARLGILGCGWLGTALALELLRSGIPVKGSRTQAERVTDLNQLGIEGRILSLSETGIEGDLSFFEGLQTLVIAIPPGLRKNPKANFIAKIDSLIAHLHKTAIEKIIFTSSTSVYGSATGIVDELSTPQPITTGGRQLLEVERRLLSSFPQETIIIRLGGLIGSDRHPIYQLQQRSQIDQASNPINLIHQTDAVAALISTIKHPKKKDCYNLVTPFHPTKVGYYTLLAEQWGMTLPNCVLSEVAPKKISSQSYTTDYLFSFVVDKLLIE